MLHEETGLVLRTAPQRAWVRVEANSACGSCSSSLVCGMTEEGYRIVEVVDPVGVEANQEVGLEVEGRTLVGAALMMYGLPLALLLFGLGVGYLLSQRFGWPGDVTGAVSALGFMTAGFVGLFAARRWFAERRTFYPTVTRIVASAAEVANRPAPPPSPFST